MGKNMLTKVVLISCMLIGGQANYCVCEDIQQQSVCENESLYEGICSWQDGRCYELSCVQRTSQFQCEPDAGITWCGWRDGSTCVKPTQCSDMSVKKWCLKSGCNWIPLANEDPSNQYSIMGACKGPSLPSGSPNSPSPLYCSQLSPDVCTKIGYLYHYNTDSYESCILDSHNQCKGLYSCSVSNSYFNCDQTYCKWEASSEQCLVKQCSDMTTQAQCQLIAGDGSENLMCIWEPSVQKCEPNKCSNIKQQTLCEHQKEGYGLFCTWKDGSCIQTSCDTEDFNQCLNEIYHNGGQSSCTWLQTGNQTTDGECYPCNNGPVMSFAQQLVSAVSFFLMMLLN